MAMWDVEAAGLAAKYLRLSDFEMLEIRNMPFIAKESVWIPYKETGYCKGKKLGEKDGKVEVIRLPDGKTKLFKPDEVELQNPPKYELLEDMANMTHLSEASIVHNLSERYLMLVAELEI